MRFLKLFLISIVTPWRAKGGIHQAVGWNNLLIFGSVAASFFIEGLYVFTLVVIMVNMLLVVALFVKTMRESNALMRRHRTIMNAIDVDRGNINEEDLTPEDREEVKMLHAKYRLSRDT